MQPKRKIPGYAQGGTANLMPHEREAITQATLFSAVFITGGARKAVTETSPTLQGARDAAQRLNAEHGKFGRRAMVYAVNERGALFPVPADWPA